MTDDQSPPEDNPGQPADNTEAQMRRALERIGTKSQRDPRSQTPSFSATPTGRGMQDGPKRRFVRDGEVPVMVVSGTRAAEGPMQRRGSGPANEQVEAAQAALRLERNAHEAAERALREAQTTIQDLRTKLGHISMARDEAIEAAKRAEASRSAVASELDTFRGRLANEVSGRARAERAAQKLAPLEPEPVAAPAAPAEATDAPAKRGRGRPPKAETLARAAAAAKAPEAKRKPGRPRIEREPEPVNWWTPKRGKSKSS